MIYALLIALALADTVYKHGQFDVNGESYCLQASWDGDVAICAQIGTGLAAGYSDGQCTSTNQCDLDTSGVSSAYAGVGCESLAMHYFDDRCSSSSGLVLMVALVVGFLTL